MADWSQPQITTNYTQFLTDLKARDTDALTLLDGAVPTNLPAKAKRWSDANKRLENWSGTAWSPLVLGLSGGGTGATTAAGARTAIGAAAASHTHAVTEVTGLQAALDGKAAAGHTHTVANVAGLQAALDGKSAVGHAHGISEVAGLQAALNDKASNAAVAGKADLAGATFWGPINATAVSQGWDVGAHAFEVRADGSGAGAGPALVAFHRGGAYAIKMGLDVDNQLKIGGWSAGANKYLIWHSGNFNPAAYVDWGTHVAQHALGQVILVLNSGSSVGIVNGSSTKISHGYVLHSGVGNHIGGTWQNRGDFFLFQYTENRTGCSLFQRIA